MFAADEGLESVANALARSLEAMADGVAFLKSSGELAYCNGACRALLDSPDPLPKRLEHWNADLESRAERGESFPSLDFSTLTGRSLRVTRQAKTSAGSLLFIQDRSESEAQLRAAQAQVSKAFSEKDAFVATFSRRLRTSLNSMLGFAQLVQRDQQESVSERHRLRIDQILEEGSRLLTLFDQVLELASVQASNQPVVETLSPYDVLREAMVATKPLARQAGMRVDELALPANLPSFVAERSRVGRILRQYGASSIDADPRGTLSFGATVSEGYARLTVANDGRALSDATSTRLFEPFFRAADSRAHVHGSMLGLAIAKALAESMNGRVGCRNIRSGGSELWLDLPIDDSSGRSGMRSTVRVRDVGD